MLNIHKNEKRSKSWPTVSKRRRDWLWVSNDAIHKVKTSHQYAHRFCASFSTYITIFCCRLVKSMWTSSIRSIYVHLKYYMHVLFLKVYITLYKSVPNYLFI